MIPFGVLAQQQQQQGVSPITVPLRVFYDTFTDSNGVLLTAHTPDTDYSNNGWEFAEGTMDIISNEAKNTVLATHVVTDVGSSDVRLSMKHVAGPVGLVFRFQNTSNYWNFWGQDGGLYEITGGVQTKRGSCTGNAIVPVNAIMKATLIGDQITIQVDNGPTFTYTDTSNVDNTKHGMRGYSATTVRVDNFQIWNDNAPLPIPSEGLVSMLDAHVHSSLYSDIGKTTLCNHNDPIAVWADLSGNGNDWVQPNASYRPLARTDYSDVYNDGTANGATSKHLIGPNISDWAEGSFFTRIHPNGATQGAPWGTTVTNSPNTTGHWNYSGTHYANFGNTDQAGVTALGNSAWRNYANTITGAGLLTVYHNNVSVHSSSRTFAGFRTDPYLGSAVRLGVSQYSLAGHFKKFCCYNRVLTTEERAQVEAWLNS